MDNNFYNIAERIEYIAKSENVSIRAIEVMVGASNGVLNKIIKNNGDLKCSLAAKILEKFPQYSAEWFLLNVGEPLKKDNDIHEAPTHIITVLFERIDQQKKENARLNDLIDNWLKQYYTQSSELPQAAEETDQKYSTKNE